MISLEASTRTCKVDTGSANRIASDRFLNPNLVVCPVWNGTDLAGREVCADSFNTKRAGCNSALDRVLVENYQRPEYYSYINLSDEGLRSNLYANNMGYTDAGIASIQEANTGNITGRFGNVSGTDLGGTYQPTCSFGRYTQAMKQRVNQQEINSMQPSHQMPGNGMGQANGPAGIVHYHPQSKQAVRGNARVTNGYRNHRSLRRAGM